MTKSKKQLIKSYIINSVAMTVCVSLMCLFLICSFATRKNLLISLIFFIHAGILFLITVFEAVSMSVRMIFKDMETRIGNAAHVMRIAGVINHRKKLGDYSSLFINIQDLKYINQRYGLDNGDEVVFNFAKSLDKYTKKHHGYAGRLGGDNFLILIKKTELGNLLDYLSAVSIPVTVNGEVTNVVVKARSGVNEMDSTSDARNLIFNASMALTNAKENSKSVEYFKPSMLDNFTKEKMIISDSKRALKENEFVPYYQPKIDVRTGLVCGGEALVRWVRDEKVLMPGEFIEPLEKCGAIVDVDFRVFELVCIDIYNWLDAGIEPVKISTNFSKVHLKDPDFIKKIVAIKDKYKIDSKYIEIELTESAGLSDFSIILDFAKQAEEAGFSVSIDDFGTGYSSLSMLQKVKVDVVKMDKSFLDESIKNNSKQFIIDVIQIVKHQNECVLFEGVETKEQLDFLKENGCDIIQGFYFDKPLPHDDFESRIKKLDYYK